jgi:gas vesicle protein
MKKFIKDNKTVTAVIICVLGFIISWGIWTTCSLFSHHESQALSGERDKSITQTVGEVKTDLKEFKEDVKEEFGKTREKIDSNQEKIINILMRAEKRGQSMEKSSRSMEKMMEKSNK